jgi:predicted DNA-binding WGR domain protein
VSLEKKRYEIDEDGKEKFWEIEWLDAKRFKVSYGPVGKPPTSGEKKFDSAEAAQKEWDKQINERVKRGYELASGGNGAVAAADDDDSSDADAKPAKKATAAKAVKKPAAKKAKAVVEDEEEEDAASSEETEEEAPAPAPAKKAAAAATAPAKKPAGKGPPAPALEDPPVPGLDLVAYRPGPLPVPEKDSTPFPEGDFEVDGYKIAFGDNDEVIVTDAKGKKLKSVPPKLRKTEEYQALMRGRKDDRARERKARRVLEERMISGASLSADEVAWLAEDDAFAPLLVGTIVYPEGRAKDGGLLVKVDAKKGLGILPLDHDARWIGAAGVDLPHPMRLDDVTAWQDLLVDLGRQQPIAQAFREIKKVPVAQRGLTESSMLSGRGTRSGALVERLLMEDGWIVRRGMARRKLSLRTDTGVVTFEAWFDYGEYYMPSDPTTTGAFGMNDGNKKPVKFDQVPEVLLSEAIRSLEVCLAQAGAKKENEDEEGEGEGEGEEGEGDED